MKKTVTVLTISTFLLFMPAIGCGQSSMGLSAINNPVDEMPFGLEDVVIDIQPENVPLSKLSDMPFIPMPVATGKNVVMNYLAEIDVSNTQDGYIMVRYLEKIDKLLKVVVKGPGGTTYIYNLRSDGEYEVLPLSEGNGYYQIIVCEHVNGKKYSAVIGTTQSVHLTDELAPFIRPNQYVNYNSDSKVSKKAAELTRNSKSTVDKIAAIYSYIIKNITYDQQLAESVQKGYIPDVDKVLQKGKGICFDYAAVMTAMLRSQGIPSKLVVGYKGKEYHAWISTYSNETGWIDKSIYFDGMGWTLLDPTFASNYVSGKEIFKYIVNRDNYLAKYIY